MSKLHDLRTAIVRNPERWHDKRWGICPCCGRKHPIKAQEVWAYGARYDGMDAEWVPVWTRSRYSPYRAFVRSVLRKDVGYRNAR